MSAADFFWDQDQISELIDSQHCQAAGYAVADRDPLHSPLFKQIEQACARGDNEDVSGLCFIASKFCPRDSAHWFLAMCAAARSGSAQCLMSVMEHSEPPPQGEGRTDVMGQAAASGSLACVKLLAKAGFEADHEAVGASAEAGHTQVALLLLDLARLTAAPTQKCAERALSQGHEACAWALLARHGGPWFQAEDGWWPLSRAVRGGSTRSVEALLTRWEPEVGVESLWVGQGVAMALGMEELAQLLADFAKAMSERDELLDNGANAVLGDVGHCALRL